MNCKNCDSPLAGNFCANCGQKSEMHRITFKHFLHEFFHAFTHTDKGILLLMKELLTRPGHVAREYLEGKRKKYFNPLSFLVIVSSLYAYISFKTGYFVALSKLSQPPPNSSKGQVYYMEVMDVMVNNGKVISLFLMPILVAFFSWLFFKRSKNNLAENLVLNSFVLGEVFIIATLVIIPCYVLFPGIPIGINNMVFHVLMISYIVVAYRQFFKNNIFLTILKVILINILFIIFYWIFIIGFVFAKHFILD